MADPLSITGTFDTLEFDRPLTRSWLPLSASVIAVLDFAGKISVGLYEYTSAVKGASDDLESLQKCLLGLQGLVPRLMRIANGDDPSALNQLDAQVELFQYLIDSLTALGTKLEKILGHELGKPPKSESAWKSTKRSLFWPFREKDVSKTLDSIGCFTKMMELALAGDQV